MSNDTLKAPSQLSAHSRIFQLISIPKLFAWEMCAARTMSKLYSRSTKNYLDCVLSHSHWTWDSDSHVTQISSSTAEIAVILRQALQVVLHETFGSNQRSTSLPRSTSDSVPPVKSSLRCRYALIRLPTSSAYKENSTELNFGVGQFSICIWCN